MNPVPVGAVRNIKSAAENKFNISEFIKPVLFCPLALFNV